MTVFLVLLMFAVLCTHVSMYVRQSARNRASIAAVRKAFEDWESADRDYFAECRLMLEAQSQGRKAEADQHEVNAGILWQRSNAAKKRATGSTRNETGFHER